MSCLFTNLVLGHFAVAVLGYFPGERENTGPEKGSFQVPCLL